MIPDADSERNLNPAIRNTNIELPAVGQNSICRFCFRYFPAYPDSNIPALVNCDCPSDDCPSNGD